MTTPTTKTAATWTHSDIIPATRESAIEEIARQDAERWGEAERQPSRETHAHLSYGLSLNLLYSRAAADRAPQADALLAAAKAALTDSDMAALRRGG